MTMYLRQKSKENGVIHKSFVSKKNPNLCSFAFSRRQILPNLVKLSSFLRDIYLRSIQAKLMIEILVKTKEHRNRGCQKSLWERRNPLWFSFRSFAFYRRQISSNRPHSQAQKGENRLWTRLECPTRLMLDWAIWPRKSWSSDVKMGWAPF